MTTIHLSPSYFAEKEMFLVQHGELTAETFRFPTGVCALRLKNTLGELVILPFQGQHIWDASFHGRRLTMKSMFDQPYPTRDFLATFGGFLQHCGMTAMGGPGPEDHHPLHGEFPNAPFQTAFLLAGADEQGDYLALGGTCRQTMAFGYNYLAEPVIKLYAGQAIFHVSLTVTNLKQSEMPLMYLAHINFRPVDHGRLLYSTPCDPEHVRVRAEIPSHIHPKPGYRELIEEFKLHPEKHTLLQPGMAFDPEVVFIITYQTDAAGWARAMQLHPDGSADVVRHRPDQLPVGVRWICRTADQDALGFEAGTAGPTGYTSEMKKGNLRFLAAGATFRCDLQIGALTPAEALKEQAVIAAAAVLQQTAGN